MYKSSKESSRGDSGPHPNHLFYITHGSLIKLDIHKENVWRIQLNWIVCQLSKLKATKLKTDCCWPSTDVQRQPAIAHRYLEKCFAPLVVDMWIFYLFFALLVYKNFTFEKESFKNKISWVFCAFEAKKIKLLRVEKKLLHKKKNSTLSNFLIFQLSKHSILQKHLRNFALETAFEKSVILYHSLNYYKQIGLNFIGPVNHNQMPLFHYFWKKINK